MRIKNIIKHQLKNHIYIYHTYEKSIIIKSVYFSNDNNFKGFNPLFLLYVISASIYVQKEQRKLPLYLKKQHH